jgi:hypothetical protein
MSTPEQVKYVWEDAQNMLGEKDDEYGDSWKRAGSSTCIHEVFRKAEYLRTRAEKGRISTPKFREDLVDLICWGALAVWHIDNPGGEHEARTRVSD